ncbi:MAG TPA: hypothetical protein EYP17_04320 [Candidatus Latescibacteria bacterium]|nr:hypothetical protein [Candidatus Latescibacterota bacterium]
MRSRIELEARVRVVADHPKLGPVYREAEEATRGKSPSASFRLAEAIASLRLPPPDARAVAKAVRWRRMLERDYGNGH